MSDFRKQWNDTCKAAGIVSIGRLYAAQLLAVIYIIGGEREIFTHNKKLKDDLDYIQDVYWFKEGRIPDEKVAKPFRFFQNEIEEYYTEHKSYPKWVINLMNDNYNINLLTMDNYIESFIAYFYDGDILTDDGVDLTEICGGYLLEEIDGASITCYDIENDAVKILKNKECKTIIKTKDGKEHVFDRSKIETFKIEYNVENFNAGLVVRYGGMPHFRIKLLKNG